MKKNFKEPFLLFSLLFTFSITIFCFISLNGNIWLLTAAAFFASLSVICFLKLLFLFRLHRNEITTLTERLIEYDKLATTGRMAAGIAHELNSPLAAMQQNSGWIADIIKDGKTAGKCDFAELEETLEKINCQIDRAQTTIVNVLGYVRNESPNMQQVDLGVLVKRIMAFLEPGFKQNDIQCFCRFEDLPSVFTHAETLQQIFVNVLGNAIDAMENGGEIQISATNKENMAEIIIADNGPGIAFSQQKRIFEPFVTSKSKNKGTGLGLWICTQLAQKICGKLFLVKSDTKGTTFCISVPLSCENCVQSEN